MKNMFYLIALIILPFFVWSQTPSWVNTSTNYATSYSFDANGNIISISRNAYGSDNAMDKLDYYYNTDKNQLNYVTDEENVKFTTDLNTQTSNNYEYDKLGRLIKDVANGIELIEYTIFDKPYKIYKNNGDVIQYLYDASSNKVAQKITSSTGEENIIYYTLTNTAQLNGVYSSSGSDISLSESHISNLVSITRNEDINSTISTSKVYTRTINKKQYPIHDHLGSVRIVVSDKKESETEASIIEESTYYPYGMQVPGMTYQSENSRFGFQGKEVITAMTDVGGSHLDFGARINDVRIAQWTSVDPHESKYPSHSPYNSVLNNPINIIDPDGRDPIGSTVFFTQNTDGTLIPLPKNAPKPKLSLEEHKTDYIYIVGKNNKITPVRLNDPSDLTRLSEIRIYSSQEIDNITYEMCENKEMLVGVRQIYALYSSVVGKMDVSEQSSYASAIKGRMAIVNGVLYNDRDFGNYLWGRAMHHLGFSFTSTNAGAELNALIMEQQQNFEGDLKALPQRETFGPLTLRPYQYGDDSRYTSFDDKHDQDAIKAGYESIPDKEENHGGGRNTSVTDMGKW